MSQYRAYFVPNWMDPSGLAFVSVGMLSADCELFREASTNRCYMKCLIKDQFGGYLRTMIACGLPRDDTKWDDPGDVLGHNCYNYACDIFDSNNTDGWDYEHPGGNLPDPSEVNCPGITARAKADGMQDTDADGSCPCRTHKVFLVVAANDDYHWYREDSDGKWSHKRGGSAISDVDASGNIITDPSVADYRYPTITYEKCGYLCAPN